MHLSCTIKSVRHYQLVAGFPFAFCWRRMGRPPSFLEVLRPPAGSEIVYRRAPKYNSKGEVINPESESLSGKAMVALGLAAIAFASRSMRRVRLEKAMIKDMWAAGTTLQGLRQMASRGEALPECVFLRGQLKATGRPVDSLTSRVTQLKPLIGQIDQPRNLFLGLSNQVKSGNIEVPSSIKHDDIEPMKDDFSHRSSALGKELLVSEIFVTRLGCEAVKRTTKDKDNNTQVHITRTPRAARFNVMHRRQVADGLHVVDENGESANLVLPTYGADELMSGDPPSLMLSLPDALNEFKRYSPLGKGVINADKSLVHMSKFIHIDQCSSTDDGAFYPSSRNENSSGLTLTSASALDELGKLVPTGWLWSGKGFYDNNPGSWSSHSGTELLDYDTFRERIKVAAHENARHQEASEMSYEEMVAARDHENCFRVVELGIPSCDVVVVGKPVVTLASGVLSACPLEGNNKESGIAIVPPSREGDMNIDLARFHFRILKGHTIDNLMKHRDGSLLIYLGFAAMGALSVMNGEEAIRNSLEITYM